MSNFGGFNANTSGAFGSGEKVPSGMFTSGATGTSVFGAPKTNASGANTATGGFSTFGTSGFGTTSASGATASGASSGSFGSTVTPGVNAFGSSNTTGTGGFGISGIGGFGATSSGTGGFGTSGNLGFGTTNAGTSGFSTASTGASGFGTSSVGGFGIANPASAFGGTNFGTGTFGAPASGAANTSAPSTGMFGGFGTSAPAVKPTPGTGFNTAGFGASGIANLTGFGSSSGVGVQQPAGGFDATELKPWELYDKISSLSEAEVKTFDLNKRQSDTFSKEKQDVPQPQPEKPTLEVPRAKGKLDCLQTFAVPSVDLVYYYLSHVNDSMFTSGLYFDDEATSTVPEDFNLSEASKESSEESSGESIEEFIGEIIEISDEEPEEESSKQESHCISEAGFLTTPTSYQLSTLSEKELRHVEGFSISLPDIGRADFAHPVDLSMLISDFQRNLKQIFKLRRGGFCVDPSLSPCPLQDTGLLGPSDVILYHIWLIDPVSGVRICSASHPSYEAVLAPLKQLPGVAFESLDILKGHWKFTYKYPN